jgi:hypothetical protein
VTTPDNRTVLSTYDAHGNPLTTTTPRGVTTTYTWDCTVGVIGQALMAWPALQAGQWPLPSAAVLIVAPLLAYRARRHC